MELEIAGCVQAVVADLPPHISLADRAVSRQFLLGKRVRVRGMRDVSQHLCAVFVQCDVAPAFLAAGVA